MLALITTTTIVVSFDVLDFVWYFESKNFISSARNLYAFSARALDVVISNKDKEIDAVAACSWSIAIVETDDEAASRSSCCVSVARSF